MTTIYSDNELTAQVSRELVGNPGSTGMVANPASEGRWVRPTRDIIEWVGAEVLAGHPFVSLDAVMVAVWHHFGILIETENLAKLLSAVPGVWVTPSLEGVEGDSQAVVSREQFTDEESVASWITSIIGPLGNSRDRAKRLEVPLHAALSFLLKPLEWTVNLLPSKFHKLSNDIILIGPNGEMVNVECRNRRGLLTSRLMFRDQEAWKRDARLGITTVIVATSVTDGFRVEVAALNENSFVIETGVYLVPAGSVEAVSEIVSCRVGTPEEHVPGFAARVAEAILGTPVALPVLELIETEIAKSEPSSAERAEINRITRERRSRLLHENRVVEGDRLHEAGVESGKQAAKIIGISERRLRAAYVELGRAYPWPHGGRRKNAGRPPSRAD